MIRTALFGEHLKEDPDEEGVFRASSYEQPFEIVSIQHLKFDNELCGPTQAVCEISIPHGKSLSVYTRFRFVVHWPKRLWRWIPTIWDRSGVLVDIRIADCRETISEKWDSLQSCIIPIPYLNLFMIAPGKLVAASYNPHLKYARVLESDVWKDYIKDLPKNQKSVAYHWCYKSENVTQAISKSKPFRCFMSLGVKKQGVGFRQILQFTTIWSIAFLLILTITKTIDLSNIFNLIINFCKESGIIGILSITLVVTSYILWLATGLVAIPALIFRISKAVRYRNLNRLFRV